MYSISKKRQKEWENKAEVNSQFWDSRVQIKRKWATEQNERTPGEKGNTSEERSLPQCVSMYT